VSEVLPVPELWKDFTVNISAAGVHDEYPGYWQSKRECETNIETKKQKEMVLVSWDRSYDLRELQGN
jgi:hypothetical protein